ALYDEALAAAGIKITQFSLLRAIERNEPAPINVLSEDLDLDRTTLARNLSPLQRDRLIDLAAGGDRRVTEVSLTAKGRAALATALPLWLTVQEDVGRRFAGGQLKQLLRIAEDAVDIAAQIQSAPTLAVAPRRNRRRT